MSIYNYLAKKSNGDIVSMQTYKDKVMLIVNTANKCGYTYQFDDLQRMYSKYKEKGLVVLGFPCNQFGQQNPESGEETAQVCRTSFGVDFPMYEVIDVNGETAHPLFSYLKHEVEVRPLDPSNVQETIAAERIKSNHPNNFIGNSIRWNFTKFLVDQNGKVLLRFEPWDSLLDIEQQIEQLL